MRACGVLVLASLGLTLLGSGCDARSRRASARLRTENASLHTQIGSLEARQRELEASLQVADTGSPSPADALAEMPQVATLAVSSMSGFEPGDTEDTMVLEVHVRATDGRQRPIQLVGPLEAQVLRPVPAESPQLVADIQLDPKAVRDAWRSSMFGATYLIPISLDAADVPTDTPLLVHIFHDDVRTGRRLEASGVVAHHSSTDDR
jgi:hypothetical protein